MNRARKHNETFKNYRKSQDEEEKKLKHRLHGRFTHVSAVIEFIDKGPNEPSVPVKVRKQGTYDPHNKVAKRVARNREIG